MLLEAGKSRLQASVCQIVLPIAFRTFTPKLLLGTALIACALTPWTARVDAQESNFDERDGKICGTVLLKTDHRALSQVAVSLKSHAAGIFRSVLTDFEGRFEVRGLPRGTYEIVVDEPGYEPARTRAQLDGPSSELVVYVRPSPVPQTGGNRNTVSVRELKIPGKAREEFRKGLQRLLANDAAGSVSHFTKATQAFPGYFEAYYNMGTAEMKLGHNPEAMQAFQRAIDLSGGGYAWADFGIGYLLYLDGKPGEAETVIRRGLEVDGNSPNGHVILGMALLRLNRADEAEKSAREALLRRPNFAEAYLVLANVCGQRHKYREQLQNLDIYLKLEPNGSVSQRVRQAREAVLRILAESHPSD